MKYSEYITFDGLGLAQLVQNKAVSAEELYKVALTRYKQVNPKLNAVVIPMLDQARLHSQHAQHGAFSGVPFLVKDLFQDCAGVPTSYGSKSLKRAKFIASEDAEIVRRWRQAGVNIMGLTNAPELGLKGVTEPAAWGTCRNPWNLKHNTGGSSGGSAAAVAAGIVPIAGANDGGGSIRIPAAYCGLFGLKPSRGRTPWGPNHSEMMHGAAIQHVLTKSVRDSAAMLDATHGPDRCSMFHIQAPEKTYMEAIQRPPQRLKIAFSTQSPIGTAVSAEAIAAIQHTAKLLEGLGHHVVEAAPAIDGQALAQDFVRVWFSQCAQNLRYFKQHYAVQDSDFELDTRALAALGAKTSALDYIVSVERWGMYAAQMNDFFQDYDLYLTPTTASTAPRNGSIKTPAWQIPLIKTLLGVDQFHHLAHGKLMMKLIQNNLKWVPFTQLANLTGLPAMSVPLYWTEKHMPLGSQFIAPFGREDRLLQLAAQLEQSQPWTAQYQHIVV